MDNSFFNASPGTWQSLTSYQSPPTYGIDGPYAVHSPHAVQGPYTTRSPYATQSPYATETAYATQSAFAPARRLPRPEVTEITVSVPHAARMHDYCLDGSHNFKADRLAAEKVMVSQPTLRRDVRAVRAFLSRAVAHLAETKGIRQFLDIGAGIPASGNTHQAACDIDPRSITVYVDNDPITLDHSRAILAEDESKWTAYMEGDLRWPRRILHKATKFIDLRKPMAIILVGVIHTIRDEQDPGGIISTLLAPAAPGSCLVLTQHALDINYPIAGTERAGPNWRTHAETMRFFDGLDLLDPGLVQVHRWRPRPGAAGLSRDVPDWGGVAVKAG